MVCRPETEKLSRICMDTPARSLKGKTLGRFSATFVARSADLGMIRFNMWRISTFQEDTSISVTNVMRSLIPTTNGAPIAQECTPARSRSECCLHNENLHVLLKGRLQLIVDSKEIKHFSHRKGFIQIGFFLSLCEKKILLCTFS